MQATVRSIVMIAIAPLLAIGLDLPTAHAADMAVSWQNGLRFTSPDGGFRIALGGRIHYDWARWGLGDDVAQDTLGADSGWELRRGRIYIAGDLYRIFFFKADWDLAHDKVRARDAFVGLHHVPLLGNVRVGNQRPPMVLELLTSSNFMTFLERSPLTNLAIGRSPGIMAYDQLMRGRRATWALGLFLDRSASDPTGTATQPDAHIGVIRITGTPLYRERGRHLLHIGLSGSYWRPADGIVEIGFVPGRDLGPPSTLNTGPLPASRVATGGIEAALVAGRWSLQSEYLYYAVDGPSGATNPAFNGFYVSASFYITGEYRPYKITGGSFFRLRPSRDLDDGSGGFGAIQLAVRYGRLDLDDGAEGNYGNEDQAVFGINWYINPAIRVMTNLTFDKIDFPGQSTGGVVIPPFDGTLVGLSFRFQLEF